jgi:hypothetical protein
MASKTADTTNTEVGEPDLDAKWRRGVTLLLVSQQVQIAQLRRRLQDEPDLSGTAEALRSLIDDAAEDVVDYLGIGEQLSPERLANAFIAFEFPPEGDPESAP